MHGHQAIGFLSPYIPTVDRGALHGQTLNDAITRACTARRAWGALSACACACVTRIARRIFVALPQKKNGWNKWKNHFYEMKEDVGMSLLEKGRNKKMPTPRHKVTHNPIPTSLFLPRPQHNTFRRQLDVKMLCCLLFLMQTNKQHIKAKQRCRDGVMSDFVSWCRHLLVPSFFKK